MCAAGRAGTRGATARVLRLDHEDDRRALALNETAEDCSPASTPSQVAAGLRGERRDLDVSAARSSQYGQGGRCSVALSFDRSYRRLWMAFMNRRKGKRLNGASQPSARRSRRSSRSFVAANAFLNELTRNTKLKTKLALVIVDYLTSLRPRRMRLGLSYPTSPWTPMQTRRVFDRSYSPTSKPARFCA